MNNDLFDPSAVFFSTSESYISFSRTDRGVPDGLYLRHLRGGVTQPETFRLDLLYEGRSVDVVTSLTPALLRLDAERGFVEICFDGADKLRVRGEEVALRFYRDSSQSQFDTAWQTPDGTVDTVLYSSDFKCRFRAITGTLSLEAPWKGSKTEHITVTAQQNADKRFEVCVEGFLSTSTGPVVTPDNTFDNAVRRSQDNYNAWLAATLPVPRRYEPARRLAAYINWSSVVHPRGNLGHPAMLMSKNWMSKIWGWDNCFNALAHVEQDPNLAWGQLMLFVDQQGTDGAFPDHITDMSLSFRFYKPPIYGWTIRQMAARSSAITDDHLRTIYDPLCRWTDWWFTQRDDFGDSLPQYNHGNESGWDNGTAFAMWVPVKSPDLATYLILQMDFLAETAAHLGIEDGQRWRARADQLRDKLIAHLWTGERFIARHAFTHEPYEGDSLLMFMPLLLGDRLPVDVREKLIAGVRRFITPHGLATEHPGSPYYMPDGYWRGPIWAPSTYLIIDGLLACGAVELAQEIAHRFCDMTLSNGMAENYDALTGVGLRDRAYTWTSSVFLLLANWLLQSTPDLSHKHDAGGHE
ncbi:MAG: glycoside hydrolase family 37 [Anaerolineae bacterium]